MSNPRAKKERSVAKDRRQGGTSEAEPGVFKAKGKKQTKPWVISYTTQWDLYSPREMTLDKKYLRLSDLQKGFNKLKAEYPPGKKVFFNLLSCRILYKGNVVATVDITTWEVDWSSLQNLSAG